MARGWAKLVSGARKFCYYPESGRSLCGRSAALTNDPDAFDDSSDDHPENCAACRKRVAKYRATLDAPAPAPEH